MSNRVHEKLNFKILTPLGVVFEGEVDQVTVTTTSGEITIFRGHTPIVTNLATGRVMIRQGEEQQEFAIRGGVLEMRSDNSIYILSNRSESASEIDLERAQEAYEYAKKVQEENLNNPDFQDYSNLQEVLEKELNRIRIAERGGRK